MSAAPAEATTAPEPEVRTAAMRRCLARNWGWMMLRGALAVVAGALALWMPGPAIAVLVLVLAAYMIADGVLAIVAAARAAKRDERWGWFLLEGLTGIAAGALAFLWPGIALFAFVLLAAAWALVSGAFMIAAAFRLDAEHGRWWLGLAGLLSVAAGVILFLWPVAGAFALAIWFGVYALAFGATLIIFAFRLRSRCKAAEGGDPAPA